MKTAAAAQAVDLRQIRAELVAKGLVGKKGALDLVAYEPAFPRLPKYRRTHFRVSCNDETLFHLVVGAQIGQLHARALDFSKACPTLICRPLHYWTQENGLEFLCLEHFSGKSLDQAVQAGECSEAQWLDAVRQAQGILAQTSRPSTKAALKREVTELINEVSASPGFSPADVLLLRDLAEPLVLADGAKGKPALRWSNGDFVGRNLLVNASGAVRLIDYEFAAPTHFARADWLRLFQFSVLPKGLSPQAVPELVQAQAPWLQIYFWLDQLSHQQDAVPSGQQERHLASAVSELFKAIRHATTGKLAGKKRSFLIDSLALQQGAIEAQLEQRTIWAKSLDSALAKARAAHAQQAKLVQERTAWAQKLNAQLKAAAEENQLLQARLTGANVPANAAPRVARREVLLHFHIFKNAGTTLDSALEKTLGPAWTQVEGDNPNEEMDWGKALKFIEAHPEVRVLSSHTLRYPPPPRLRGIKFIPLLLLRHPIDRLVSIYHFERTQGVASHSETSRVAQTGSLADFVRFTLARRPEIGCDTQTAIVARSGVYDDPPTAKHLAAAQSALEDLPVTGVVERLDQYLVMLEMEPSLLPPNSDLARPDENRNAERAPTLLARLRKARAELPPALWHELCERNRLDLALWRRAHHLANARFSQKAGAAERLVDFRRRKTAANEAALQSKELVKQAKKERGGSSSAAPLADGLTGIEREYALLKETAEDRLAWAQTLDKELRATQVEFEKLTREFAERTAWATSLEVELKEARAATAAESKQVEERTVWAQGLDAELSRARAALAEQSKLVDERTAWAKALDADLERARAAHAEQSKLVEERTSWAMTLDAELTKARAALAEQAKLVEKSSAWGKALSADLLAAQNNFAALNKEHAERTAWARKLEAEMQKARTALAAQTKVAEERTAWAKKMDNQLGAAIKEAGRLQGEHVKAVAWARSLDAELHQARTALAAQTKQAEERANWGKSLGAELQAAKANFAKLTGEHAERTAWAQRLESELQQARAMVAEQTKVAAERTAWAQKLDAELAQARLAHAEQAKLVEARTAWAKNLETQLGAGAQQTARLQAEHAKAVAWAQSLDVEVSRARTALSAHAKLAEERTAWGKSLEADLNRARTAFAQQAKLVEERSVWAKSLSADLQVAQDNFARLTREHDERTAWAKNLTKELETARGALAAQAKLLEERTTWAQSLARELKKAQSTTPADHARRVEELTAWGAELQNELATARANFTRLEQDHAERTTWAKSLVAELQGARDRVAGLTQLAAERAAACQVLETDVQKTRAELSHQTAVGEKNLSWAKSLEAELEAERTKLARITHEYTERTSWALALDAELAATRRNYAQLQSQLAERTAWAASLDAELHKARAVAAEREHKVQQTQAAVTVLRRDLIEKKVEARATAGSLLDAQLRTEVAESEVRRLTGTLNHALGQVNRLLRQGEVLRQSVDELNAIRLTNEATLQQQAKDLNSSLMTLQGTRKELARYESRLICRLAARRRVKSDRPHQP